MKLVKEYINFQRNVEPKDAMNTGNKVAKYKIEIKKAIQQLAHQDEKRMHITEDEEDIFVAGFTCRKEDYFYFIGYGEQSKLFVGYYEKNGPREDTIRIKTVEEGVEKIAGWNAW